MDHIYVYLYVYISIYTNICIIPIVMNFGLLGHCPSNFNKF